MNKQEIFDTVVNHLAAQQQRSMAHVVVHDGTAEGNKMYTCAYRGEFGMMCAVGCLIKDEDYNPKMETHRINVLAAKGLLPQYLMHHTALLEALQYAHDSAFNRSQLIEMLENTASLYQLDTSSVGNIKEWGE
jgi:hypothetical protein